jgi:hypothetical protein
LLDLKHMSIEELTGRLTVVEADEAEEDGESGKLLLTRDEWRVQEKGTAHDGSGGSGGGHHRLGKNHGKGRDERIHAGKVHNGSGSAKKDDECCYSGKKGHWARECQKKKVRGSAPCQDRW